MRVLLAIALVLLPVACAAVIPHATRAHAELAGVPLDRLEHGRQLFVARCGNCHQAPAPSSHSAAEWSNIVPEMLEHANLEPAEGEEVLVFLKALASDVHVAAAPAVSGGR